MASMLDTLIETILKDYENLQEIQNPKTKRKEFSLLRARTESAIKLASDSPTILKQLNSVLEKLNKK